MSSRVYYSEEQSQNTGRTVDRQLQRSRKEGCGMTEVPKHARRATSWHLVLPHRLYPHWVGLWSPAHHVYPPKCPDV